MRSSSRRRLLRLALAVLLLMLVGWLGWRPLLRTLALAWIVEQPVEQADAIVLTTATRQKLVTEALGWFRDGRAPLIVLLNGETQPTERAGITEPVRLVRLRQLQDAGVPDSAVIVVGHELTSLEEEFTALRGWAQSNRAHRLLVPVEPFVTRRVAWFGRRMLAPADARILPVPVPVPDYSVTEWWRNKEGLIAFENEWVMMLYYWLRY